MEEEGTVFITWSQAFYKLSPSSANLLGIMCYVAPVSVPQTLFDPMLKDDLPPELRFCSHELL